MTAKKRSKPSRPLATAPSRTAPIGELTGEMVDALEARAASEARRPKVGQPPALMDRARRDEVTRAIARGHHVETAAALVGVCAETLRAWLRTGRKMQLRLANGEIEIVNMTGYESAATVFSASIGVALARAEDTLMTRVEALATTSAAAATWMLANRFPTRWGSKARPDVTQDEDDEAQETEALAAATTTPAERLLAKLKAKDAEQKKETP